MGYGIILCYASSCPELPSGKIILNTTINNNNNKMIRDLQTLYIIITITIYIYTPYWKYIYYYAVLNWGLAPCLACARCIEGKQLVLEQDI